MFAWIAQFIASWFTMIWAASADQFGVTYQAYLAAVTFIVVVIVGISLIPSLMFGADHPLLKSVRKWGLLAGAGLAIGPLVIPPAVVYFLLRWWKPEWFPLPKKKSP